MSTLIKVIFARSILSYGIPEAMADETLEMSGTKALLSIESSSKATRTWLKAKYSRDLNLTDIAVVRQKFAKAGFYWFIEYVHCTG